MKKPALHKMRWMALLCIGFCLSGVYLWAMFRPGVWLRDTFLYRQTDGGYVGRDAYGEYTMHVSPDADGAEVRFTLDGETKAYKIEAQSAKDVKIYQDGQLVFTGEAWGDAGNALLWKEDGGLADEVDVVINGQYQKSDLWPTCNWLYNVAVGGRSETRGNPAFLILIGVLVLLLAVNIRFPLLAWKFRHGLEVSGGEPSEWYYTSQRIGRFTMAAGIVVAAVMSFFVH